jgi:hypothetical protein
MTDIGIRSPDGPASPPYAGKRLTFYHTDLKENDKGFEFIGEPGQVSKAARQGTMYISMTRTAAKAFTSWDGNPDTAIKALSRNYGANTTAFGGTRVLDIQARNSGTTSNWVKAVEMNARNDSGKSIDTLIVQHIRAENYGTVDTEITGFDVEMSSENDTSSPIKIAMKVRNTDASGMTAVRDVFNVSHTSTNGFTNLFRFNATTGDTVATGTLTNSSAGDVLCDARIICSINGTAYYIPLFDTAP